MMLTSRNARFAKALSLASALLFPTFFTFFTFFPPAPARAEPPPKNEGTWGGFDTAYVAVPVSVGVISIFEIPELNQALTAQGLDTLPRLTVTLNAAITRAYANGVVVEPHYRFTILNNEEATVTCHHLLLNAGYLIASRGDVTAYPMIGAGFGISTLEVAQLNVEGARFDEVLAKPEGDALLASSVFMLHAGFAANLWGSGHGDFIGLRTGILFAPTASSWKRRGYTVYGGPPPPIAGGYLALAFGFGAPFEE